MKAYLVLGLPVSDYSRFKKYIAEIPAFIAKQHFLDGILSIIAL